jgi:hypothetical protein
VLIAAEDESCPSGVDAAVLAAGIVLIWGAQHIYINGKVGVRELWEEREFVRVRVGGRDQNEFVFVRGALARGRGGDPRRHI